MAQRLPAHDTFITWLFPLLLLSLVIRVRGELLFDPKDEDTEGLPIILWWAGLGMEKDYVTTCDKNIKCLVAHDISAFHKDDIMVYVFYGSNFLENGLPFPRHETDIWALVHEESPKNSDWIFSFESTMELFNYTATFKRESDMPIPIHWLSSESMITTKEYMISTEAKNRLRREGQAPILFVHSDCSTPSNREQFVGKLMEYIDVDSYGSCLKNKEFPKEYEHLSGYNSFEDSDFYKFVAGYKFSMAYENALCDDYVTEKLWRPLMVGSVPIVHGSSKVKDFLPTNKSAIVINDFESIEELTAFIKQLDEDDEEYNSYLRFKEEGISNPVLQSEINRVRKDDEGMNNLMSSVFDFECFLCKKLHEAREASESGKPVQKVQASIDHFGCPLPKYSFDDIWRPVPDANKERAVNFYTRNAQVFRDLYDKGQNVTAEELYDMTTSVLEKETHRLKDEF